MKLRSSLSNYILKVTSANFKRKENIKNSSGTLILLVNGFAVIFSELYLVLISLPTYFIVKESDLKKQGYDDDGIRVYKLRKRISVSTIALAIFLRLGIFFVSSFWFGSQQGVSAFSVNYDFTSSSDYIASNKIQITDGLAVLKKDQGKLNKGDLCSGSVATNDPLTIKNLEAWTGFSDIVDPGNGSVGYQISLDNKNSWLYWDGTAWSNASDKVEDGQLNTNTELSENITKIDSSNNQINIKAYLYGSCEGDVKLLGMGVSYDVQSLLLARRYLNNISAQEVGDQIYSGGDISIVEGVDDSALNFNGVVGAYAISDSEGLYSPQNITVSVWAKPAERKTAMIVDKGGWKSSYSLLQDKWNGWTANIKVGDQGYKIQSGDGFMTFDEWNLATMTYDGVEFKLYVNGVLTNSTLVNGDLNSSTETIYIGSEGNSAKFFNGAIDDFRLYNYALSQSEISELYNSANLPDPDDGTVDDSSEDDGSVDDDTVDDGSGDDSSEDDGSVDDDTVDDGSGDDGSGDDGSGDDGSGDDASDPVYPYSISFPMDEGNGFVSEDEEGDIQLFLSGTVWDEGINNLGVAINSYGDSISSDLAFIDKSNALISFWLRESDVNSGGLVKLKDSSGTNLFYLSYSDLSDNVGAWVNLVIYLEDGSIEVYVDGNKIEGIQENYHYENLESLVLGGDNVIFDEIRVYNVEFSEMLIQRLTSEYDTESKFQISGFSDSVSFVNENENVITETDGYVAIKKEGLVLGELELNDDITASNVVSDVESKKLVLHFEDKSGIESVKAVLAKSDPQASIRICPNVVNLTDIVPSCAGEIILSEENNSNQVYSLINLEDENFWYISAPIEEFSTGIEEFEYGLVAHWDLDETDGTQQVDTKNALVATEVSNVDYVSGMLDSAADFNNLEYGPFQHFFTVDHSSLLNLANAGSVCSWVYLDEAIPYQGFVHKGGAGDFSDAEYSLQTFSTGKEFVFNVVSSNGQDLYVKSDSVNLDTWYFVCGSYSYDGSNTQLNLYVNGNLDSSKSFNKGPRIMSGPLQIGSQLLETSTWQGSRFGMFGMNGLLDEVRIYNIELSQEQIQTLMLDVNSASIEVLTPTGGEYISGSVMDIQWDSEFTSGSYDLVYSTDGFNNVIESIAQDVNSNEYSWLIPSGINGNVEIRVYDSEEITTFGTTDTYLSIIDPLPDSEIFWKFNEGSGCEFVDESGLYSGILGDNCESDLPVWKVSGFDGSALSYSGDAYAQVDDARVFNPTSGLTLSAWIKWEADPLSSNSWAQIMNKNGDDQFQIQHNKDNDAFEFAVRTDRGRRFLIGDTQPMQGVWYFVTATYDGSSMKIYVNGELDAQSSHSGDILSSESPLLFGKHLTSGRYFPGIIDNVRFYNYALDEGDISQLYVSDSNTKPEVNINSISQDSGSVLINYDLIDEDNDYLSLSKYEYSADEGDSWVQMTPSIQNDEHSGVSGLLADTEGISYSFVWNSLLDLGEVYLENVLVRFESNDTLTLSDVNVSDPFVVDNIAPEITNLSVSQSFEDGEVHVTYVLSDDSSSNIEISVVASDDLGLSWNVDVENVLGDVGIVEIKAIGETYEFIWDVKEDYPDFDSTNLQLKITVKDEDNNSYNYLTPLFVVDTKDPFGASNFTANVNAEYSVNLTWNSVEQESNFDRYQIIYSDSASNLENMVDYSELTEASLNDMSLNSTLVTELEANSTYYFKLLAWDVYGNSLELPIVSATTLKDIDIENIVLSALPERSNQSEVLVYGISVPNEYVTLDINDDSFEDWELADEFGYFERTIDFEDGVYSISVSYSDVARNLISNTVEIEVDTVAPAVSTLDYEISDDLGYIVLEGSTDTNSEILLYVGDDLYDIEGIVSDNDGEWSQEIFVSEDMYDSLLTVVVVDSFGNESLPSIPIILPSFYPEPNENSLEVGDFESKDEEDSTSEEEDENDSTDSDQDVNSVIEEPEVIQDELDLERVQVARVLNQIEVGEILEDSVSNEIFEYRESRLIDSPEVLSVTQNGASGNIVFGGRGIPNSEIVLFVHSDEAFAVKTEVDEAGYWNYTHLPESLALEAGDHEVYAVTVDENSSLRSKVGDSFDFMVEITPLVLLLRYIDLPTTIIATVILIMAIVLYLYSRNKFNAKPDAKK